MIQDTRTYSIALRPRFKKPGRWFAWVRVPGQRDLKYWPVSEREAMDWYDNNMPLRNGAGIWSDKWWNTKASKLFSSETL